MNMKQAYVILSILAATWVLSHAVLTKMHMYGTLVFLCTSKPAILTFLNMIILLSLFTGKVTLRMFFGSLRDSELEDVWTQSRTSITENLFALTMFREELGAWVAFSYALVLFCKVFHWIAESRVEFLGQLQNVSLFSQFRIFMIIIILMGIDSFVASQIFEHCMKNGPSAILVFGFEFLILFINSTHSFIRFIFALTDIHYAQGNWHGRSMMELYVKVLADTAIFLCYLVFAGVVFAFYGVPLHLLRELYVSASNLHERVLHLYRFRVVMHHLHQRFPTCTDEQLNATDKVCIICREDMSLQDTSNEPKVLDCGHIFHKNCLQTWLNTRLTCPHCRHEVSTHRRNSQSTTPAVDDVMMNLDEAAAAAAAVAVNNADAFVAVGLGNNNNNNNIDENANNPRAVGISSSTSTSTLSSSGSGENRPSSTQEVHSFLSTPFQQTSLSPTSSSHVLDQILRSANQNSVWSFEQETEFLKLQIDVFKAQTLAANATHSAAIAVLRLQDSQFRGFTDASSNGNLFPTSPSRTPPFSSQFQKPDDDIDQTS